MKKFITLLLVGALTLSLFSGCGKKIDNSGYVPTGDAMLKDGQDPEDLMPAEEDKQELTLAYYAERSLNPLFGSDYSNRVLMSLMYQGLFAVDANNNPTPILCARYQVSPSNRTWTFYLEDNATFSDGSKVTPEDVIASYEQAMQNDYYKNRFFHIDSISRGEDGGIVFGLKTAFENLPLLLDIPIVKAADVALDGITDIPRGTGPYTLSEGISGAYLSRDTDWWCGSAKIPATDDSIQLVNAETPAQVRDAFQFGDVSVVCTNPQSDAYAEYRCDFELWEIESGYFMYIGCNIGYSDFFEDGTLRTFLTYAIDRATIAETYYNGLANPVTLPTSPNMPYYNETLAAKYEYDSMKFIDALSRYHIPTDEKGVPQEMKLLVNSSDSARVRTARYIAQTLTELGLPCTTVEYGTNGFNAAVQAANYDIYLGVTKLSPNYDLTEFFRPWGEMHWGGLTHETLYDMCLKALENSGNYYNLYEKLAPDGRIIPVLFGYQAVYARRGLLPDLNPARDNVFYYSLGKTMDGIQMETVYD